jgi:hypothetical protein
VSTHEPHRKTPASVERIREIVLPHEPEAGPLTALRNVLIQFSIGQLKATGHYQRYSELIDKDVLADLLTRLGPGWIPTELVMAHYEACDRLGLSERDRQASAAVVGDRLQETTLISSAKKARVESFDVWSAQGQLNRMWRRLHQGGSMQIVKVGPKAKLIEQRDIPLNRIAYYREAQVTAITVAHTALGARLSSVKLESTSPHRDETVYFVSWE